MVSVRRRGCAALVVLCGAFPAFGGGLSQSDNFLVLGSNQPMADEILQRAEECRRRLALQWLGRELPAGSGRALICVSTSATEASGGFLPLDDSGRRLHRIRIAAPPGVPLDETLAHEVTHLVMQVAFSGDLPAWANEGVAMFEDGQHLQEVRAKWIRGYARSSAWPRLAGVLDAPSVRDDIRAYALAESLTKYLLTLGDASTFFSFAVQGKHASWEEAAKQCYGLSLGKLQSDWQSWESRVATGPQLIARRQGDSPPLLSAE